MKKSAIRLLALAALLALMPLCVNAHPPVNGEHFCEDHTGVLSEKLTAGEPTKAEENTHEINCEIENVASNGSGIVSLPPGLFYIETLFLKSNMHLQMADDTTLVAGPISRQSIGEIRCGWGLLDDGSRRIARTMISAFEHIENPNFPPIRNIKISGGRLVGPNTSPAYCNMTGIRVQGNVKGVIVDGTELTRFTSGIGVSENAGYLPSDINIEKVQSHGNRHLGIAITGGYDIAVLGGQFNNNGLAGIDVENHSGQPIHNLRFIDIDASYNSSGAPNLAGSGLVIQRGHFFGDENDVCPTHDTHIYDVEIRKGHFVGNTGVGLNISGDRLLPAQPPNTAMMVYCPDDNQAFDNFIVSRVVVTDNGQLNVSNEPSSESVSDPQYHNPASGIRITNTQNWSIRGSVIQRNGNVGITAFNVANFNIVNNLVEYNQDDGIRTSNPGDYQADEDLYYGEDFAPPQALSCGTGGNENKCRISNNVITNNDYGILASAGVIAIKDNEVRFSHIVGISVTAPGQGVTENVEPSSDVELRSNVVGNTGDTGISVGNVDSAIIINNQVTDAGQDGLVAIEIGQNSRNRFAKNTILYSSRYGVNLSAAFGLDEQDVLDTNEIGFSGELDIIISE